MGREFPQAPVVGVAGIVIRSDEVLLIKRLREPLQGEWSLPGGVLELGESMRDGAAREVFEETGLVVRATTVVDVVDRIHHEADRVKFHYVLIDFLCVVAGGKLLASSDAQEARWVQRDLISCHGEYQLAATTVLVIEKAFDHAQTSRLA